MKDNNINSRLHNVETELNNRTKIILRFLDIELRVQKLEKDLWK